MQFLTPNLSTLISLPDVTVNVNNTSPSASATRSDNARSVVVVYCCPTRRVTSHWYWYSPEPPKAKASQLNCPLALIWDGPLISNESDCPGSTTTGGGG